ncbi:hypothetical protein [Pseudescherichia sp.]|uniref:hypothetical protein n=1 Tax=Pseudescherichia sp. TaxID=2055881 RepID=UPI00289FFD0A|nr:hypothetical protein [Pseudescherichia sp.]
MKKFLFAIIFISWGVFASCPPTFSEHPVKNIYTGDVHSLALTSEQENYVYGEYLNAAKNAIKVNFAGHYIVFIYGCGGGVLCAGVKDAINGQLLDTGAGAYDMTTWEGAKFEKDSSLLIISGRNLESSKAGDDYFKLDEKKLIKISECN